MNKNSYKITLIYIIIELLFFILIGSAVIWIYGYPLKLTRLRIIYICFGTSAIFLFNFLKYVGFKEFIVLLIILTILLTAFIFNNFTILSIIRHSLIVIVLGIIVYLLWYIFPNETNKNYRLIGFIYWILAITLFFYVFFISKGLILKFRHGIDAISFSRIAIRGLKFGPVFGFGIGFGFFISSLIIKK